MTRRDFDRLETAWADRKLREYLDSLEGPDDDEDEDLEAEEYELAKLEAQAEDHADLLADERRMRRGQP